MCLSCRTPKPRTFERMSNFVHMRSSGLPPANPNAHCAACGMLGTAGRVVRRIDDVETDHVMLCARCWPAESNRFQVRWQRESEHLTRAWMQGNPNSGLPRLPKPPSTSTSLEAATWDISLQFLIGLMPLIESNDPPPREQLREWAHELQAQTPQMIGPMPPIVEWFISTYSE